MNLSRIHRLLKLIGLLQAGKGYNIERLAMACRVSRRTIFRDLDVLRQSGVPLHFDQQSQQLLHSRHLLSPAHELHARRSPGADRAVPRVGRAAAVFRAGPRRGGEAGEQPARRGFASSCAVPPTR